MPLVLDAAETGVNSTFEDIVAKFSASEKAESGNIFLIRKYILLVGHIPVVLYSFIVLATVARFSYSLANTFET